VDILGEGRVRASAKILVTLVTLPVVPLLIVAGLVVGAAVAIKMAYLWFEFVWEGM
jgi:hypothetical protein